MTPEYLRVVPNEAPAGRVVVHNHIRPTMRLGSRGFRAWLDAPGDQYAPCDCGWAPNLGIHYRVVRVR